MPWLYRNHNDKSNTWITVKYFVIRDFDVAWSLDRALFLSPDDDGENDDDTNEDDEDGWSKVKVDILHEKIDKSSSFYVWIMNGIDIFISYDTEIYFEGRCHWLNLNVVVWLFVSSWCPHD